MTTNIITDLSHQVSNYWNPNMREEKEIWDYFIPNKQSWDRFKILDKKDWYYILEWEKTKGKFIFKI